MIIHLIRHTTPNVAPGICYGQADLDVTDSFSKEAQIVRSKLLDQYDRVYSSPLQRCSKLASACTAQNVELDERLMEFNFGAWELKPWDQITGPEAQAWFDDFVETPCPDGESLMQMQSRVLNFYEEVINSEVESVAVFTHSGVQRIIHAQILATPLEHIFRLQLAYGTVIECSHNARHKSMTVKHL